MEVGVTTTRKLQPFPFPVVRLEVPATVKNSSCKMLLSVTDCKLTLVRFQELEWLQSGVAVWT